MIGRMNNKKFLLSGVKPTGRPHIGNYFGAMKQFVDLQKEYENYIFVATYHAFTSERLQRDTSLLQENILDVAIDYLAIGVDPTQTTLYSQTDVPEVTELAWIFNCLLTVPYLMRAHAYKDAEAKGTNVNVGTFDYPVLMAADILIMQPDVVPVGKDQKQHLEIARDIAGKFNKIYGDTFKLPDGLIKDEVAIVPGTDGQKMSKSYGNTIPLFATREEIQKAVMGIVTDSASERPKNVYDIHKLFKSEEELESLYAENAGQYKALKDTLVEDIDAFIAPLRTKRAEIAKDKEYVLKVLEDGGKKAKARAEAKMEEVRKKIGVTL